LIGSDASGAAAGWVSMVDLVFGWQTRLAEMSEQFDLGQTRAATIMGFLKIGSVSEKVARWSMLSPSLSGSAT